MNRHYILGGLLFLSLAANAFLGSMEIGKKLPFTEKVRTGMQQLNDLPEPQHDEALDIVKQYRPQVKEQLATLRKSRRKAFAYLSGKDYNRIQAESRFKEVRDQADAVQELIHRMTLDLADKMTPEQRATILQPGVPHAEMLQSLEPE